MMKQTFTVKSSLRINKIIVFVFIAVLSLLISSCILDSKITVKTKPSIPDTEAPSIIRVSSSTADGTYKFGNIINIEIEFSEPVIVTGIPQLEIQLADKVKTIDYAAGSESNKLIFIYVIGLWETTTDLDYTNTNALNLNSASIKDFSGNDSVLTLDTPGGIASLGGNHALVILSLLERQTKLVNNFASTGPRLVSSYANYGKSVAYSEDGLIVAIGATYDDLDALGQNFVSDAGAVFIYTRDTTASPWVFQQKIVAQGTNARNSNSQFGSSLALSGVTLAVGAHYQSYDANGANFVEGAGAVYIYTRVGSVWSQQQKIVAEGANARVDFDYFGSSVSLSADTLVVGAPLQDYDAIGANAVSDGGAVYVYTRSGAVWSQQQKIVAEGTNARVDYDSFGSGISLSGDTLAVGASNQDYDASGANIIYDGGAVYVYTRSGSVWSQQQKIVAAGTNARVANDYFGYSLSLYGESLAVGAYNQDYNSTGMGSVSNSGAVYVYTRTGSTWSQQQKIVATGSNARKFYDEFGHCLSLYGETLAVGAHFQNYDAAGANILNNTGAVYVYTRSGSTWSQQQKIVATGTNARVVNDEFGSSVALVGDALLAGAPNQYYDSNGMNPVNNAGAVYDFKRSGSVWSLNEKLVDTQAVTASRLTSPYANYGATVTHSNDGLTLAVGVSGDTLDGSGQNPLIGAGSVFIYTRSTTASPWVFQQKIIAEGPNARMAYDSFGASVSLSADTLAVGAPQQAYDAIGSNAMGGAGAVYVYTHSGGVWTQQQKIVPEGSNARNYYESFGRKLSLAGDTLAIGVSSQDYDASGGSYVEDAGAVFVFSRTANTWSQQQKIVPEGTNARVDFDYFGSSISFSEETLVIGASGQDYDASGGNVISDGGAVYVFTRSGTVWSQQQKIVAEGTNARVDYDNFGSGLSLSGNTLAVGAYGQDYDASGVNSVSSAGAVYIFTRSGDIWSQQQKIIAEGTNARMISDYFGSSLSLSGNTLAVGAYYQDYDANGANPISDAGAIYIYTSAGGIWKQQQKIVATGVSSRTTYDNFGLNLFWLGEILTVGVSSHDYDIDGINGVSDAGAVYVLEP